MMFLRASSEALKRAKVNLNGVLVFTLGNHNMLFP